MKYIIGEPENLEMRVAPPCGVRGLKSLCCIDIRSPSDVAPPCGVRGLKYNQPPVISGQNASHPLAGCVD